MVDSIAEAEQQLAELANGQGALKALEAELDSLAEYANEMSRAKIFTNPYGTRFGHTGAHPHTHHTRTPPQS